MASLSGLYQDLILDHNRAPQNYPADGRRQPPSRRGQSTLRRPVDRLAQDGRRRDQGRHLSRLRLRHLQGLGFAHDERGQGKDPEEAEALFERFHRLVTGWRWKPPKRIALGKLVVFSGLSEFPIQVKCASLSWHALKAALDEPDTVVSTE